MRTVVMTGGTSGIGAIAAERLASDVDVYLIDGARSPSQFADHSLHLDLASLSDVDAFIDAVAGCVGDHGIDAVVLNAGIIRPDISARSAEGFEMTFAVNYLSHYLIARRLWNSLRPGARIIVTTSGTHDPAEHTSFPTPHHADAHRLAHPDRDPFVDDDPQVAARRAYTASKLCLVMLAAELARESAAHGREVRAIAFCPGQTPGTGLVRNLSPARRMAWRVLGGPMGTLVPHMNRRLVAGRSLAGLATGSLEAPEGELYAALRDNRLTWRSPAKPARDRDLVAQLWHTTAELLAQR